MGSLGPRSSRWRNWVHHAEKVQAIGFEGSSDFWAGENGVFMGTISTDEGFHLYGILHDTLIDTISYVANMDMGAGVGLWINVGSNVVLVGTGLKQGWFFQNRAGESTLRSAQYMHNQVPGLGF